MDRFADWWYSRSPRERVAIGLLALIVAGTLVQVLVLEPAGRAGERARAELRRETEGLVASRRRAAEIAILQQREPPPSMRGSLRSAVERELVVLGAEASVEPGDGDRLRVSAPRAAFAAVVAFADALQRNAGARVNELAATGVETPGVVRVEMLVGR